MRRLLVEVDHRRYDVLLAYLVGDEIIGALHKGDRFVFFHLLEQLGRGGYQRLDHKHAVAAKTAARAVGYLLDRLFVSSFRRGFQVDVVPASFFVDVGI